MEEGDERKLERMKELEEMVHKLTLENELLLNQVKGDDILSNGKSDEDLTTLITTPKENDNEIIPLTYADIEEEEDTW